MGVEEEEEEDLQQFDFHGSDLRVIILELRLLADVLLHGLLFLHHLIDGDFSFRTDVEVGWVSGCFQARATRPMDLQC